MLQKHFNPVRAVKYYLLFSGMDVDEGSFESVEEVLGPFDIPEGIVLTSLKVCNAFANSSGSLLKWNGTLSVA